jgi:lipopolysaccharide transport system ATP-binding protein
VTGGPALSEIVIRVEGLGKSYRLRHERYEALRDVITDRFRSLGRRLVGRASAPDAGGEEEEFWALRDVGFDVKRGEVLGIIGRNGAGKSTLLKVLSRITEPTEGRVTIRGRVASLLEVGTGFHPELTGRENIYLNGAILGMTRSEIRRKFDEIVAFAETERFLDTPVKRYSSGMYVRLAFAVAAHLEPDILVVDEVLAVGDAEFQRKCLGKMRDVSQGGRTVLFVSHNMAAVQALCGRGVLLDRGRVVFDGRASEAVRQYLESGSAAVDSGVGRPLSKSLTLVRMECEPAGVRRHAQVNFHVAIDATADEVVSDLALLIHAPGGELAALIDLRSPDGPYRLTRGAQLAIRATVRDLPFVENELSLGLYVDADSVCHSFLNLSTLSVLPSEAKSGVVPRDAQFRGLVELDAVLDQEIARATSSGTSMPTGRE